MRRVGDINYFELVDRFDAEIVMFSDLTLEDRQLVIRHDVDHDLNKAVALAKQEHRNKIRSTYFLLHSAPYFNRSRMFIEKCKILVDLGHELGFHNNILTMYMRQGLTAVNHALSCLQFLRDHDFKIRYTSAHGSIECRTLNFSNYEFWTECSKRSNVHGPKRPLEEFDLQEVYFMPFNYYLSDSGGRWRGGCLDKGSCWFERSVPFILKKAIFKELDGFSKCSKISAQLLTHPKWWIT